MRLMPLLVLCGAAFGCQMPTSPRLAEVDALVEETAVPAPRPPIVKRDEGETWVPCDDWVLMPVVVNGVVYYEYVNQCH